MEKEKTHTTYEVWQEGILLKELYNYAEFKKELLMLDAYGYSYNSETSKSNYYKVVNGKIHKETNNLNN